MLPLATTKISVYSRAQGDEVPDVPYHVATSSSKKQLKASGVRAVIGLSTAGTGGEVIGIGGEQSKIQFNLNCDPCDINHLDIVVDEITGQQYEVVWATLIQGLGLSYIRGGLSLSSGTEFEDE